MTRRAVEPSGTRMLDGLARAQLEVGDLLAAAARGLALAQPMGFATIVWRLRMVQATASDEPTDRAATR